MVLIVTDDQGFDDMGCYGAKDIATPNLDRLAKEGRRFTNFHASQPICTASRAGLITGCYATRIGFKGAFGPHSDIGIAADELTLPQMFKAKGYATGMVGKWHLGDAKEFLPTHRGFDEYYGIPYSHDMWKHHPEFPQSYPNLPLYEGDKVINPDLGPADLTHLTKDYTARAVDFIQRNKDRPFFLYVAHNLPHVPLFVSDQFKGTSKRGLYGDVIQEIDWSVGELEKTLKKDGLDQNTLIVFTSDNGPWLSYGDHAGSAYPLREGKHTNWEGGTRVPCLMKWPGQIPNGTVSDQMLASIDLLPTLADRIGAVLPAKPIDGKDIWTLISSPKIASNPHDAYYFYYGDNELQAVTSGDGHWKLVLPHTYVTLNGKPGGSGGLPAKYDRRTITQPELYDLNADKEETKDLAAQQSEVLARMMGYAEKARADLGDSLTNRVGAGVRSPGRVSGPEQPQLVGKRISIKCDVETTAKNGVILAQGGARNGYALSLLDGEVIFNVRLEGKLFEVASVIRPGNKFSIEAVLKKDGTMSFAIDNKPAGEGKASGIFKVQPTDPLSIGEDTITAVGNYTLPNKLTGNVTNVEVKTE